MLSRDGLVPMVTVVCCQIIVFIAFGVFIFFFFCLGIALVLMTLLFADVISHMRVLVLVVCILIMQRPGVYSL